MWNYNYFTYILTNSTKNVLYVGVTNDLIRRIQEHKKDSANSFTAKYFCHYLVYYERHTHIQHAISREKEIKGWRREKKLELIRLDNPQMLFLNDDIKTD